VKNVIKKTATAKHTAEHFKLMKYLELNEKLADLKEIIRKQMADEKEASEKEAKVPQWQA
jgi:hypothetical protein